LFRRILLEIAPAARAPGTRRLSLFVAADSKRVPLCPGNGSPLDAPGLSLKLTGPPEPFICQQGWREQSTMHVI
jgi:hypothetical protein